MRFFTFPPGILNCSPDPQNFQQACRKDFRIYKGNFVQYTKREGFSDGIRQGLKHVGPFE